MQQLIFFLQKYKYFLYFLFLQIVAFALIVNNHSFHKSKLVSSSNYITGSIYEKAGVINEYLSLKSENNALLAENTRLRNELNAFHSKADTVQSVTLIDSSSYHQTYTYISGKIRKNQYQEPYNFITINRGEKHGVSAEMAVANGKGIIGITDNTSHSFARVQSILNRNSKINARFKNNFQYGTLIWNGQDYNTVQLTDIPRQAEYKIGDTIITGGKSTIFPEGLLIGAVSSISNEKTALNTIDIKLFNDMSNIGYVYVIKSLQKKELQKLETLANE